MVLLHQRGALHQRLLYRYSASGDDVPDALLEEGPPVSWEHSIVSSIWGCPSMDYIPKIAQNIFKLFSGDDLYMICKPLDFFKGTSVHHYCFDYCWQVLREGLHPDGRRQLRLIQIHQHLRITHHHFDTFVRRLIDLGAVGRAFWWLGKNIAHLQKNTIVSSKFKASQRYYPYYALKTRAQQPG